MKVKRLHRPRFGGNADFQTRSRAAVLYHRLRSVIAPLRPHPRLRASHNRFPFLIRLTLAIGLAGSTGSCAALPSAGSSCPCSPAPSTFTPLLLSSASTSRPSHSRLRRWPRQPPTPDGPARCLLRPWLPPRPNNLGRPALPRWLATATGVLSAAAQLFDRRLALLQAAELAARVLLRPGPGLWTISCMGSARGVLPCAHRSRPWLAGRSDEGHSVRKRSVQELMQRAALTRVAQQLAQASRR